MSTPKRTIRLVSPYGYLLLMDYGHRIYNGAEGEVVSENPDGSSEVRFGPFTAAVPGHWQETLDVLP